jgi:hypothetical protein
MVAAKSEYLAEGEIYKRFIETRDCFLQKGDQLGDRYDAVLLFAAGAFAGAIFLNGEPIVHKGMTHNDLSHDSYESNSVYDDS